MGCTNAKPQEPAEENKGNFLRAVKSATAEVTVGAPASEPRPHAAAAREAEEAKQAAEPEVESQAPVATEAREAKEHAKEQTEVASQASAAGAPEEQDAAEPEAEPPDESPRADEQRAVPEAVPEQLDAQAATAETGVAMAVADEPPHQPTDVEPEREAGPAAPGPESRLEGQAADPTAAPSSAADWLGSASLEPPPAAALEEAAKDTSEEPPPVPATELSDGMTPWRRQQSHRGLWKSGKEQQPAPTAEQPAPAANEDELAADLVEPAASAAEEPGAASREHGREEEEAKMDEDETGAVYELYWIRGLTQRWGEREHRVLLTRSDADSAFASVAPHSRVCIVTRRDGDGGSGEGCVLVTSCYRAWLPPARWHEAALSEWVRREHPTLSGDNIFAPAAAPSPGRSMAHQTSQQQLASASAETPSTPTLNGASMGASSRSASSAAPPPVNSASKTLLTSMPNVFSAGPEGAWTRAMSFK